jgi:hypothetical protein
MEAKGETLFTKSHILINVSVILLRQIGIRHGIQHTEGKHATSSGLDGRGSQEHMQTYWNTFNIKINLMADKIL